MSRAAWIAAAVLATLSGCRCDDPGSTLVRSQAGFRVDPEALDFGKLLEGDAATKVVRITSTAPFEQLLRVVGPVPFTVAPWVVLPPAGTVELPITFSAIPGEHTGSVGIASDEVAARVTVTGRGVRPLPCVPSELCRVSRFDLETETCLESVAADGTSCDPPDVCEVDGQCRAGVCRGQPRSCDDNNACTLDGACIPGFGCLNRPRVCPGSQNPCEVPACSPLSGCTLVPAPAGMPCGPFESCARVHLCSPTATCEPAVAPDGFPCSPPTPCREGGVCEAKVCVEPDAGTLAPTLVLPLDGEVAGDAGEPVLFASEGNLFAILCDADGGCGLRGWTGNLLQLFHRPFDDPRPRTIAAVAPEGVWLLVDGGVERHDRSSGVRVLSAELGGTAALHGQALASSGDWVGLVPASAVDGGEPDASVVSGWLVRLAPDGGRVTSAPLDEDWSGAELALTATDEALAIRPGGLLSRWTWGDAGTEVAHADGGAFDAGTFLAIGPTYALLGGRSLILLDGGTPPGTLNALINGEPAYPVPEPVLLTREGAFVLLRSCAPHATGDCPLEEQSLWVRKFDPLTATPEWTQPVLSGLEEDGYVAELLSLDGGVGLVTQRFDGSVGEVRLQGLHDGDEYLSCPLEGPAVLGGVVFEEQWMYALLRRDGGWTLEGYDLTGAPVDTSGWPARHGVSGTRRARP